MIGKGKDDNGSKKYRKLNPSASQSQAVWFWKQSTEGRLLFLSDTLLHLDRLQNEDSLAHHAKLNKTLEAQSKIKKINATRQTGEEQEMVNRGWWLTVDGWS